MPRCCLLRSAAVGVRKPPDASTHLHVHACCRLGGVVITDPVCAAAAAAAGCNLTCTTRARFLLDGFLRRARRLLREVQPPIFHVDRAPT